MNARERLSALQSHIDSLTLRERGILFLVVIVVLYFLCDTLLLAPQERSQKALLDEVNTLRQEISQLEQQSLEVINRYNVDPNAEEQQLLTQLQQNGSQLEQQITAAVNGMIPPQEMAKALESVLKEQKQLTFVRIENLGATPLLSAEPDGKVQAGDIAIYKHTMRLELEGDYHHTLAYLQALEALPWRFHWESVKLNMLDYPRAQVVITVNTLSLSEGWIGV